MTRTDPALTRMCDILEMHEEAAIDVRRELFTVVRCFARTNDQMLLEDVAALLDELEHERAAAGDCREAIADARGAARWR